MTTDNASPSGRLPFFPISFFASIMGLAGLSIAWTKAQHVWDVDLHLTLPLALLTLAAFLMVGAIYIKKVMSFPEAVAQELQHPVKLSFFPAISISLILLAIIFIELSPTIARGFWLIGTSLHLVMTLFVLNAWMHQGHFQIQHITPAWFIPAVGNVLVPIAGMPLGYTEVSWFFFSIGLLFWIVLLTIVFYRILFHAPIDERLLPTLFILVAPPAVGFISYMKLHGGGLDPFARILFFSGLFLALMLTSQLRRFIELPFALSWWAYSFPTAAITIANYVMYQATDKSGFLWLGNALLLILTALIGLLVLKTFKAIRSNRICVPGH